MKPRDLSQCLAEKRVLIVCGTGGVGKTSVSAALALAAAVRGRRVGLVTIDPAKRLASALGLSRLDAKPRRLDSALAAALGGKKTKGSLSALMFDAKDALDRFVETTGGEALLARMRANNIYKILADNFSGAHEYLALEKLYELEASKEFDLIVLDTPPARHTLDFLDAPGKIGAFLDDRIFQWFLTDPRSGSLFERMRARGTQVALGLLEKVTGEGVIRDFTRLAPHLHALKTAFMAHQNGILEILRSDQASAIFVATGLTLPQRDFHNFWEDAIRRDLRPAGLVVNRSLLELAPAPLSEISAKAPKELRENYALVRRLVEAEERNIARAARELGTQYPFVRVPELGQNIQRIPALVEMGRHLAGDGKD